MPDKDDPKYKKRYEREVNAGRKFADVVGISWLSRKLQGMADKNKTLFLIIVFGVVLLCFAFNLFRMVKSCKTRDAGGGTATERVESILQEKGVHQHNDTYK